MSAKQELERYLQLRTELWRETLAEFDAATVANIIRVLASVREGVRESLLRDVERMSGTKAERLRALDAWLTEVLTGASATMTGIVTEAAVVAATASLAEYNAMLSLEGTASAVQTVGFTKEQLATWFRETAIFEDMKLTTRMQHAMSMGTRSRILDALRGAGSEGKGTAEAVRRVLATALEEGFKMSEREAVTLARSYIQAANVGALDAVMQANKGMLQGWIWLSSLSTTTCPRCGGLDGTFYKIDDQNTPPMPLHYRCRCIKRMVVKDSKYFGSDKDVRQFTRLWEEREAGSIERGGKLKVLRAGTTTQNYGAWFTSLPAKRQIEIVGPKRAALLQSGKIGFHDLVDKQGRLVPLEELHVAVYQAQGGKIGNRMVSVGAPQTHGGAVGNSSIVTSQAHSGVVSTPDAVEKALSITRGQPIDYIMAATKTNPQYQTDVSFRTNCQRCVPVYELRRRGYPVTAMPRQNQYNGKPNSCDHGYECFESPQVTGVWGGKRVQGRINLLSDLHALPDDARVGILWAWPNGGAHTIVCEKINGKLFFIDPQTGTIDNAAIGGVLGVSHKQYGYSWYRMDDLNLNPHMDWTQIAQKE